MLAPSLGQLDVIVSKSNGCSTKGKLQLLHMSVWFRSKTKKEQWISLLSFPPIRIYTLKSSTFASDSGSYQAALSINSFSLPWFGSHSFQSLTYNNYNHHTKIMAALPTPTSILDINAGAGTAQSFKGNTTKTFFSTLVTAVVIFAIEFGIFLLIKDKLSRI